MKRLTRDEVREKLQKKGYRIDEVSTILVVISRNDDFDEESLPALLAKNRFLPHEITHICTALFS